jgi:hypothetical protein
MAGHVLLVSVKPRGFTECEPIGAPGSCGLFGIGLAVFLGAAQCGERAHQAGRRRQDLLEPPKIFQALKPRLWTERPIGTVNPVSTGGGPFDQRSYDLTPDGKRIIAWDPNEVHDGSKTNLQITVRTNWFGEVEGRFARGGR